MSTRWSHARLHLKNLPYNWTWLEVKEWIRSLALPVPNFVYMFYGADTVSSCFLHYRDQFSGQLSTYCEHMSGHMLIPEKPRKLTQCQVANDTFQQPKQTPKSGARRPPEPVFPPTPPTSSQQPAAPAEAEEVPPWRAKRACPPSSSSLAPAAKRPAQLDFYTAWEMVSWMEKKHVSLFFAVKFDLHLHGIDKADKMQEEGEKAQAPAAKCLGTIHA